jgi:hypothetical protein
MKFFNPKIRRLLILAIVGLCLIAVGVSLVEELDGIHRFDAGYIIFH